MPHNAGKRLTEAISKQLERIGYFSSAAYVSPNLAVHEMQKSFKRLRILRLCGGDMSFTSALTYDF